jgi:hypothetical protein
MITVKLTTSSPEWPLFRQRPASSGIRGNCRFYLNEKVEECDFWIVYEGLKKPERAFCAQENIIFITGEPPHIKPYNQRFLKQFGMVATFRKDHSCPK